MLLNAAFVSWAFNALYLSGSAPQMGGTPYNKLYREGLPRRGTFSRIQVHEKVGNPLVEVDERVGKSVILVCEKG